jgi:hypothetical protein
MVSVSRDEIRLQDKQIAPIGETYEIRHERHNSGKAKEYGLSSGLLVEKRRYHGDRYLVNFLIGFSPNSDDYSNFVTRDTFSDSGGLYAG